MEGLQITRRQYSVPSSITDMTWAR